MTPEERLYSIVDLLHKRICHIEERLGVTELAQIKDMQDRKLIDALNKKENKEL